MDAINVVSDIGDAWSPKTPPPRIAASAKLGLILRERADGNPIGIIIAKVPHEVPVEKATNEELAKSYAGKITGFIVRVTI